MTVSENKKKAREHQPAPKHRLAQPAILVAAILWGIIGLWNRNLMDKGLSATNVVALRNFGGILVLTVVFLIKDRSAFRIKKEHLKYFFGTGVISVVLFTCCYFSCQKLCSLAVASILLYTAPSFVVILSAILWKEPITRRKLAALLLTLAGCSLVCGVISGKLTVTFVGVLLGIGSGFFYALYSVIGRYALKHYPPMTVTLWTFIFAGIASLVFFRPGQIAPVAADPVTWLMVGCLVILSTVLPYILYTYGLSKTDAGKASIMASFEPVAAALLGILVFGEPISTTLVIGVLLVLTGVCIL